MRSDFGVMEKMPKRKSPQWLFISILVYRFPFLSLQKRTNQYLKSLENSFTTYKIVLKTLAKCQEKLKTHLLNLSFYNLKVAF